MLYQFIVDNYKSFRDETTLNLAAASYSDHSNHVCEGYIGNTRFLKSTVLYGANASGKTNLINAISFASELIVNGTVGEMPIALNNFRLSKKLRNKPSRFEFIFEFASKVYHYGFVLTTDQILEEWLSERTNSGDKLIFERFSRDGKAVVKPGKKIFKTKSKRDLLGFVAQTTRVNQLFLKEAFEKNISEIKNVFRFFSDKLQIIPALSVDYRFLEIRTHSDESFSDFLGRILKDVGTGIEKIATETFDLDFDKHLPDLDAREREYISSHIRKEGAAVSLDDLKGGGNKYYIYNDVEKGPQLLRLRAMHKDDEGNLVSFELKEESAGTRRYLNLLPLLYGTQAVDRVYIVDELDRRLHPDLVRVFLEHFFKLYENNRSQLIFTTHNTQIMDQELLRRDEIWFIEKDLENGASTLYPLTDMSVRKDLKLDKAYLHGRFGAVPKINPSFLYPN
ncbi:MAG: ATP/GTP-binding protein [Balneolaceae bacterium]